MTHVLLGFGAGVMLTYSILFFVACFLMVKKQIDKLKPRKIFDALEYHQSYYSDLLNKKKD